MTVGVAVPIVAFAEELFETVAVTVADEFAGNWPLVLSKRRTMRKTSLAEARAGLVTTTSAVIASSAQPARIAIGPSTLREISLRIAIAAYSDTAKMSITRFVGGTPRAREGGRRL